MDTKQCRKCNEVKSYSEFHNHSGMKDGKSYYCKECKKLKDPLEKKKNSLRAIQWRENNLERWRTHAKKARKKYNETHPEIHARRQLSKKIRNKLKKPTNVYSPSIGCSSSFLKLWIEKQFAPDMNWQNHGVVWNIDHIIPLSGFNLFDDNERLACNHYLNIRPIYTKDNERKGFKYNPEDKIALIKKIKSLPTPP